LLNASVGVQRVLGRVRRTSIDSMIALPSLTRPRVAAGASRARSVYLTTSRHIYPLPRRRRRTFVLPALTLHRPSLTMRRPRVRLTWSGMHRLVRVGPVVLYRTVMGLGHERVVAIAAAGILLSASFLSVTPGGPRGDTGGPSGDGPGPRLALAGSTNGDDFGTIEERYTDTGDRPDDGIIDGTLAHPDLEPASARYVSNSGVAVTVSGYGPMIEGPSPTAAICCGPTRSSPVTRWRPSPTSST
jgi:hypothetical protein